MAPLPAKSKKKLLTMHKADEIFSVEVRTRDNFTCVFCLRTKAQGYQIQNSHYWGRGNKTTRFDLENCDALCAQCHMKHEGSKQGFYTDWKLKQLGKEKFELLRIKAMNPGKLSDILIEFQQKRAII